MSTTLYTAASGTDECMKYQEIIARNLAANNVPGYKREFIVTSSFKSEMSEAIRNDPDKMLGVSSGRAHVDFSQGALHNTARPLDFAISGEGFFEVTDFEGRRFYTRDGSFSINSDRVLVTSEGFQVSGKGGKIRFSKDDLPNNIELSADGYVKVRDTEDPTILRELGRFKIMSIEDKTKLFRHSAKYFTVSESNRKLVKPVEYFNKSDKSKPINYEVYNSNLESSNTVPVNDMVEMIQCMRNYEMGTKVIKLLDELAKEQRGTFV